MTTYLFQRLLNIKKSAYSQNICINFKRVTEMKMSLRPEQIITKELRSKSETIVATLHTYIQEKC